MGDVAANPNRTWRKKPRGGSSSKLISLLRNEPRLRKAEPRALQHYREPGWSNIDPIIVEARTQRDRDLCNYWRHVISSEPQVALSYGRDVQFYVIDRNSGLLLGLFTIVSALTNLKARDVVIGWSPEQRKRLISRVVYLSRCLPTQPFGSLIGGKLLALMATASEVIRTLELRYSFPIVGMMIRTLHGKSSQYNRLEDRWIEFIGDDGQGKSLYLAELKSKGFRYLRGDAPEAKMRPRTFTIAQQVDYWKQRWYLPRLESMRSTRPEVLEWDPSRYALARVLDHAGDDISPLESEDECEETN